MKARGANGKRPGQLGLRVIIAALAMTVVALFAAGGCSASNDGLGGDPAGVGTGTNQGNPAGCAPGHQGCSCTQEGATAACGSVHDKAGNYVTCSMGTSTCTGGAWGACVGNHLVTKSVANLTLSTGGLRLQTTTYPTCTNVCDPNGCLSTQPDPNTDVDAAGIGPGTDGGITLLEASIEASAEGGVCSGNCKCIGLQCQIATCGGSGTTTTTLSGTVYDPAGNNPLYNATVYIPINPKAALPAFGTGATCDTCSGSSFAALQATTTDASGNFTLSNVPSGSNIPIVVQLGKWRREILITKITSCVANTVTNNCTTANAADCLFRLPKNHTDGYDPVAGTYSKADMPQIAIVSGASDPFDCLLLKAGIDPAEVGDYTSTKRVHYYRADTGGGNTLDPAYGMNVAGSTLWNNLSGATPNMMAYDLVLLPCQGGAYDAQGATGTNTPYQNLISYADSGGRVFTTHFSYSWLEYPAGKKYVAAPDNWSGVADWSPTGTAMTGSVDTQDPLTGTVTTSFPKGGTYSQWLQNVGATAVPSQLTIHEGRQDLNTVGSSVQGWMTANDRVYGAHPNYTNLFTFNTPYGAAPASQCGRVVYSDFHVSAAALASGSSCLTNADCGFTATCNGAKTGAQGSCSEPCGTSGDCPNTNFTCAGSIEGTCSQTTCTTNTQCNGRACIGGQCACSGNTDCNSGSCQSMACTSIACTSSAQCGKGTCAGGTCSGTVSCHSSASCGLGTCGGTGHTGTCAAGTACHLDSQCGIGGTCGTTATGGTAGTCLTPASNVCHKNADCDSNSCGSTTALAGTCTTPNSNVCHSNADCDSAVCGSGTGGSAGACAIQAGATCHSNADCDSNSCGSGTNAGTCTIGGGTPCGANTDCDSNTCGSGTNGVTGTCQIQGGATCHSNADCDSSVCGSGTGGAAGTCTTSGQSCTASTQCDSGSCTGGTCSFTTGHACHLNTDCDNNNCGGGVKGTCGTSTLTLCHSNANCDSNSCGTGSGGSLKGICTAGACTASSQCGTGGVCNLITKTCTAGACSLDTNCGTAGGGGVCTGATCTAPAACSTDANCPATKCNGATCGAAQACGANSTCTASGACLNATCTSKSCAADATCTVTGSKCNGATCSTPAGCKGNVGCTSSHVCTGATCGAPAACASDAACTSSKSCVGAKCSTKTCAGDASCTVTGSVCTNAKCTTQSCAGDAACTVSGSVCNGAKCGKSTCSADTDCVSGTCSGATCTFPPACGSNTDCGTSGGKCSGATCSASACGSNADCGAGSICAGSCAPSVCVLNGDCATGACVNGTCGCASNEDCGGSQNCNGATSGLCQRTCTQNSDCAPDLCVSGKCGGCTNSTQCHDNGFSPSCGGIPSTNYGTCSINKAGFFPEACRQGTLSSQEKALEFMFFDLTSCVTPDNLPPPPPITTFTGYLPATFTQDFVSACAAHTVPVWREFDWQSSIPSGASIVLSAQSGATTSSLLPATPVTLATATASTSLPNYDVALIDTSPATTGAFNMANPKVLSGNVLRVTITMNPTSDLLSAPTLLAWKVQYDCMPAE